MSSWLIANICPCTLLVDTIGWCTSIFFLGLDNSQAFSAHADDNTITFAGVSMAEVDPGTGTGDTVETWLLDAVDDTSITSNHHKIRGRPQMSSPECVICLEEFDATNPVMPTLCECGENKSQFHYPCLLLWLEQKAACPTCSSTLFYQEVERSPDHHIGLDPNPR